MKVNLTDTISYYYYTWDTKNLKEIISTSYDVMESVDSPEDGHGLFKNTQTEEWVRTNHLGVFKELILYGLDKCKELYTEEYKDIKLSSWINVVRAKNTRQQIRIDNDTIVYHTHTEISSKSGQPRPEYTFVFYIQMPDNLTEDDGKLFIMDNDGTEKAILPKVGELIILDGDVPHAPLDAPNSTKDRIVLAGNVCFIEKEKTEKTLL